MRAMPAAAALGIALALGACSSAPTRPAAPRPAPPSGSPAVPEPAPDRPLATTSRPSEAQLLRIPDAVPRAEPRARLGNPPFYEVYGQRYTVLSDGRGYSERGVASWYGPDFHGAHTSTGEPYDMYSMTAAHRTLPLPAYARVTNLRNGHSVTVRINDRGPFKANRIIDLSYAAALRLDMVREGTTLVEVQAITPDGAPPPAPPPAELYAQAGAFAVGDNAERLRARLAAGGIGNVRVREDVSGGRSLFRVRIGPIDSVATFDTLIARLKSLGVEGATLAPN